MLGSEVIPGFRHYLSQEAMPLNRDSSQTTELIADWPGIRINDQYPDSFSANEPIALSLWLFSGELLDNTR
ncbi:MAG: hypothetical protein J5I65_09165 [Aridibacter famidurans]|nr:hypothetical protein [Aridibacter famidurans]